MKDESVGKRFFKAAHALSHQAPTEWERFVEAFDDYAAKACVDSVKASVEVAHVAQGRAQSLLALGESFRKLDKLVEDYNRADVRK